MSDASNATIIAALIGASGGSLLVPFVKDFLIQKLNDRRSKSEKQEDIFRNYAAPLTGSGEKLLWRFNEIFLESRHQFLKTETMPAVYNQYKRTSTLYRIASVLGWIRAMHLEMSALPRGASGFSVPISEAISKIQSALADGPHVELHRLKQVCVVWGVNLGAVESQKLKVLATKFEVKLYELGGDTLKHDSDHLKKIVDNEKLDVCKKLSRYLCAELQISPIIDQVVEETLHRAIQSLSYREALIYRDWQDAISDSMLEPDRESVRRFNIIGFKKFETVLAEDALWMEVFKDLIVDIDFDTIDPSDFRSKQLRDLASGVSDLILSLAASKDGDLVGSDVKELAYKLASKGLKAA